MTKRRIHTEPRRFWSKSDIRKLKKLYPDTPGPELSAALGRQLRAVYAMASHLGLHKSDRFLADAKKSGRFDKLTTAGMPHRFPKGHVPPNKGIKGWQAGGRSKETQFKKGHKTPHWSGKNYSVGDLRFNADGYVDIKVKEGYNCWRQFHVFFWEHFNGPLPKGHCLRFKDGDRFNIDLDNLQLLTRAENLKLNSIYNYPPELVSAIKTLGALKRRIRERNDPGFAKRTVRNAERAARRKEANGHTTGQSHR